MCVQSSSLKSLSSLFCSAFLRLERKRKRECSTVEQQASCHGKNIQNVLCTVQCFCHTYIYQTALSFVFHKCLPANDDPVTPEEAVEEAEAMVPEAAYNSLSEKYDQLNTEYVNLRKDFYQLKEENERLK